jgi:branched-chain amino acid transport system permease protein
MISGYWVEIINYAAINAIISLGLWVAVATGQLSVGHAAFAGIGGYASALLTRDLHVPFLLALVAGAVAACAIGMIISLLSLRLRHMFLAIATLGFGEAMVVLLLNIPYVGGVLGFQQIPLETNTLIICVILGLLVFLFWRLQNSRLGQAFRVVKDDELIAAAIGIDVGRTKVLAFAISAFVAGLGGGLYAHLIGIVLPTDLGFAHSLNYLIFVIVGGSGTFGGPIVGSALLTVLPELLRFSAQARYVIFGLALLLIVIFRSKGLITRRPIGTPEALPLIWLRQLLHVGGTPQPGKGSSGYPAAHLQPAAPPDGDNETA